VLVFLDDDGIPDESFVAAHRRVHRERDVVAARGRVDPRHDTIYNRLQHHYDLGSEPFPHFINIEGNYIVGAGDRGINKSGGGQSAIKNNLVRDSGEEGIFVANAPKGSTITTNLVADSSQNGNNVNEMLIDGTDLLILGNYFPSVPNSAIEEGSNASFNLYIGNRGPTAIVNIFRSISSDSWGYANFPALFESEGSVTLTSGSSPAARVDNVATTEGLNLKAEVQPDPTASQPDANYAWETYTEWDYTNGQWDLVVEWRTDPGANVKALYQVEKDPTSRGIRDL